MKYGLTGKELAVLALLVTGLSDKQIAAAMGTAVRTAQKHMANIRAKFDAPNRVTVAVKAVREGLV